MKPEYRDKLDNLPKPRELNCLEKNESENLFAENKILPLSEKIALLTNYNVIDKALWINVKEGIDFRFEVEINEFKSSSLSETNYSSPKNGINKFLYYRIKFIMDAGEGDKANATVFLHLSIDQGLGAEQLPSEIFWLKKEEELSGTEVMHFTAMILDFLQPKIVYLNDAAKTGALLRMLRPVWKGQSFY